MSRALCLAAVLALNLWGCGGHRWSSVDDCAAISDAAQKDECFADTLPGLFRTDRPRAEKLTNDEVSDVRVRDFIWLTVTREVDPGSYRYCERIQDAALAARCKVLVSRPHLHRELNSGAGQAPPTGSQTGK